MSDKKLKCEECGKQVANTSNVLARHLRTVHDVEWSDYVVRYQHGGQWPTCVCGCGQRLEWKKGGFGKYIQGHDNQGSQNSRAKVTFSSDGWVINPFTGREERIENDNEIAFLEHCADKNDPITHDHNIRIGWEDVSGKLRVLVPSFKHLQKRLIITLDNQSEYGFDRRLSGLKTWCNEHSYMLLVVQRIDASFDVIAAFRGKGVERGKEQG